MKDPCKNISYYNAVDTVEDLYAITDMEIGWAIYVGDLKTTALYTDTGWISFGDPLPARPTKAVETDWRNDYLKYKGRE
jgi:hypothetical protein